MRNESERIGPVASAAAHYRPTLISLDGLSKSISVGTRKVVNYAWIG